MPALDYMRNLFDIPTSLWEAAAMSAASQCFEDAYVDMSRGHALSCYNLGVLQALTWQLETAEERLTEAIALDEGLVMAYAARAVARHLRAVKGDEAALLAAETEYRLVQAMLSYETPETLTLPPGVDLRQLKQVVDSNLDIVSGKKVCAEEVSLMQGRLKVSVHEARQLKTKSFRLAREAWAVVRFGGRAHQTQPVKGSSPTWKEKFEIQAVCLPSEAVEVSVYTRTLFQKKDELVGTFSRTVNAMLTEQPEKGQWVSLRDAQGFLSGDLRVCTHFVLQQAV